MGTALPGVNAVFAFGISNNRLFSRSQALSAKRAKQAIALNASRNILNDKEVEIKSPNPSGMLMVRRRVAFNGAFDPKSRAANSFSRPVTLAGSNQGKLKEQYPDARMMKRAFLLVGACFLLLTRPAGADDAYGVPTSAPPPIPDPSDNSYGTPTGGGANSSGSAHETEDVQSKMAGLESKYKTETTEAVKLVKDRYVDNLKQLLQSEIDKGDGEAAAAVKKKLDSIATDASPATAVAAAGTGTGTGTGVNTPKPVSKGVLPTNSPEPYALKQLRLKYETEIGNATDPQALSSVQSTYYDLFKQLLQKEMLKGDESAALAVKLEMMKTGPGYPFTRRWAAHGAGGGFSIIQFKTDGTWAENTNNNFTFGQWHSDDNKNAVVNFPNNTPWQFQLNEAGHLIRNDGLDYGPDDQIQAADGSLTLGAEDADITGLHLQKEVCVPPCLVSWTDTSDSVTWQAKVRKPGTYRVVFNYGLPPECQGSVVVLSVGSEQLNFTPSSTGDWNTFQDKDAGQITLKTGPVEIELTAEDKPGSGVMNLRSITFVPVDPLSPADQAATDLVPPKPL
jgi:hypothetical protein